MFDATMRSIGRPRGPRTKFHAPLHPLCPDSQRLDKFLAQLLDFIAPRQHSAAATMELMPVWLQFLEAEGLLDASLRKEILLELPPVAERLRETLRHFANGQVLAEAVRAAFSPENHPAGT